MPAKKPARRKLTKTQRLARERLLRGVRYLNEDSIVDYMIKDHIPKAWTTLEQDIDVEEPRVKVTLRLDESVAKFYRAMGRGYQRRMNRVLGTYAQMQIAELMGVYQMAVDRGEMDCVPKEYRDGLKKSAEGAD